MAPIVGMSIACTGPHFRICYGSVVRKTDFTYGLMPCEDVQVILELVFGFREDYLTPENVNRCTKTFTVWEAHLFSYPIDLPGFGAEFPEA